MRFRAFDDILPDGVRRDYKSTPMRVVRAKDVRHAKIVGSPVDLRHGYDDMRGIVDNYSHDGPNLYVNVRLDENGKKWVEKNNWRWSDVDARGERHKIPGVGMSMTIMYPPESSNEDNEYTEILRFTLTNDPKYRGCFILDNYSNDTDKLCENILNFTLFDFVEMSNTQQQSTQGTSTGTGQTQGTSNVNGTGNVNPGQTGGINNQGGQQQGGQNQGTQGGQTQGAQNQGTQGGQQQGGAKTEDVMDIETPDKILGRTMTQFDAWKQEEQRLAYEKLSRNLLDTQELIKKQNQVLGEYRVRDRSLIETDMTDLEEYLTEPKEDLLKMYDSGKDINPYIKSAKRARDIVTEKLTGKRKAENQNPGAPNQGQNQGQGVQNQGQSDQGQGDQGDKRPKGEQISKGGMTIFDAMNIKARQSQGQNGHVPYYPHLTYQNRGQTQGNNKGQQQGQQGTQNQGTQNQGIPSKMNTGHNIPPNNVSLQGQGKLVDDYSHDKQNQGKGYSSKVSTVLDDAAAEIEAECMRLGISLEEWNEREEKKLGGTALYQ